MRPAHAQPAQPLPNRTHPLRRRKHDKGGTRVGGRHNSEEKKRCRKCKKWGIPMHHSKPTTSSCGRCMHSQHNPCPTELTNCGEGSMTRERSAWWGDINEKRNEAWEVNKGGHSHAPLQTHNVLMRPVHAQPAQPLPNRTHKLRGRKHDKGGKRMVGRHKREEK